MTDDRVDELRRQLRSLGYLEAGVDRFLLAPASGSRGPIALAARASARVGLLGGVLLGPAAAIGIGARLPGLMNGVRDAIVIAIYLAVFFLIAISATSFAVTFGATLVARGESAKFAARAARVSRLAGWITSLACLGYLTLWWRNANAGFGWSAPLWTAFALLVAVAISLLLGHAQRITTLAVLASAAGPAAALPPVGSRSWRMVLAGGLLAFAGAGALLVATTADVSSAVDRAPLAVAGTGVSIRLIAIDGFDPELYISAARSATYRDDSQGASSLFATLYRLDPQDTRDPARAWTTIATGQPPDVHGVHKLETRKVAGIQGRLTGSDAPFGRVLRAATDVVRLTRPAVASRDERRSKTIWEVAEDAGLRTAVINWWATWPAPPGPGIVISDRALLRLEHGGALDSEIAPAELYPDLQKRWPQIRADARETAEREFPAETQTALTLRRSAELDSTILGLLAALAGPRRDLEVVYLPGLDIAQHALLNTTDTGASSPSVVSERVEALKTYYSFLDRTLQPLIRPAQNQVILVLTSPGRVESATDGWLSLTFRGAIDLKQNVRAAVVDLAPTVLHMLGVPLSRELPGRPIRTLTRGFEPRDGAPRYVPTYGRPASGPTVREGKPLDQEAIDRLRSLGYVR